MSRYLSHNHPVSPCNDVQKRPYVWPVIVVHQAECATKDLDAWRQHRLRGVERVQAHDLADGTILDTSTDGLAGRYNIATAKKGQSQGIHSLCDCVPDMIGWRFGLLADGTVDEAMKIGGHYGE